uniref:Uncharacterized protein n=1 Tax=Arundo donax TaxID=35708 RepID=A0A0A9AWC1_ARUDO
MKTKDIPRRNAQQSELT